MEKLRGKLNDDGDSSPFGKPVSAAFKGKNGKANRLSQMGKPLQMKKKKITNGGDALAEELSEVDEEEEKRMALAFTELKRDGVYR